MFDFEYCDCYRHKIFNPDRTTENRYFHLNSLNFSVNYLQAFGQHNMTAHFPIGNKNAKDFVKNQAENDVKKSEFLAQSSKIQQNSNQTDAFSNEFIDDNRRKRKNPGKQKGLFAPDDETFVFREFDLNAPFVTALPQFFQYLTKPDLIIVNEGAWDKLYTNHGKYGTR